MPSIYKSIAEGIETGQQAAVLRELGCDHRTGLLLRQADGTRGVHSAAPGARGAELAGSNCQASARGAAEATLHSPERRAGRESPRAKAPLSPALEDASQLGTPRSHMGCERIGARRSRCWIGRLRGASASRLLRQAIVCRSSAYGPERRLHCRRMFAAGGGACHRWKAETTWSNATPQTARSRSGF